MSYIPVHKNTLCCWFEFSADLRNNALMQMTVLQNHVTQLCLHVFLRPLWVEYPQDPATFALDDEFLIGETQNTKTIVFLVWTDS